MARAPRPGERSARDHRRPRLRPDHPGNRPHPRARTAARPLRAPRGKAPRWSVCGRRRLRPALVDRHRHVASWHAIPLNHRIRVRQGEDLPSRGNSLIVASLLNGSRWSALPVVALLITACGGGSASVSQPAKRTSASVSKPKATATKPPNDTEQLNKLLILRSSALQSGEADTYSGTATGAEAAKDKRIIARAKLLPLNSVRMLARATEVNKDRATMRVVMVYSFKGIETEYVK